MKEYTKPELVIFDLHDTLVKTNYNDFSENNYSQNLAIENKFIEGVEEFIGFLRAEDIKTAVMSNAPEEVVQAQVYYVLGAGEDHFDAVFGVCSLEADDHACYKKPSIALGQYIAEQMDVEIDPENCNVWMIGDSDFDTDFATNNGFLPIGFNNKYAANKELLNFESYADLQEWTENKIDIGFFDGLKNIFDGIAEGAQEWFEKTFDFWEESMTDSLIDHRKNQCNQESKKSSEMQIIEKCMDGCKTACTYSREIPGSVKAAIDLENGNFDESMSSYSLEYRDCVSGCQGSCANDLMYMTA